MSTEVIKALRAVRRQLKAEAARYRSYALNPHLADSNVLFVGENALLLAVKMIDLRTDRVR